MANYEQDYKEITQRVLEHDMETKNLLNEILSFCLQDVDFETAKKLCVFYYSSTTDNFRYISILCTGHIARVYKQLVDQNMINEIKKIASDSTHEFYGVANDALDDIETFVDKDIRN